MADTQGFEFNLGVGVIPEVDQKKHPDIYNECAQLRRAIRLVASALGSSTGSSVLADVADIKENMFKVKRIIDASITIPVGVLTATYTIVPAVSAVDKMIVIPLLISRNKDATGDVYSQLVRLQKTSTNTITAIREFASPNAAPTIGFQIVEIA